MTSVSRHNYHRRKRRGLQSLTQAAETNAQLLPGVWRHRATHLPTIWYDKYRIRRLRYARRCAQSTENDRLDVPADILLGSERRRWWNTSKDGANNRRGDDDGAVCSPLRPRPVTASDANDAAAAAASVSRCRSWLMQAASRGCL